MCGIAGIHAYREAAHPVDGEELLRIRESMMKRGPDGAGLWVSHDRRIGLAHRRLAIIDTGSTGTQPMATADGQFHITFNGEIYNYRELKRELEAKGYRFRSNSDTEVLLYLYADRGERMLDALRGMYAFGIWDERKQSLFLARDPFGIKPLYYADDGKTLRFASQVKALLKGGAIDTAPEPAGSVGFLVWGSVPEPYTLYRHIRSLPSGHSMRVHRDGVRAPASFFNVCDAFAGNASAGHIVDALRDSVMHHMVADVPVGSFLSAGLDSATLCALATQFSGHELHTLTLGFREYLGTENDETSLAQQIAGCYGARHDTRWIAESDFESELDALFEAMDQPSIDGVNTYFVSKAAAAAGMKVAISGVGGDELFGGYPSFRDVPRLKRFADAFGSNARVNLALRRVLAPIAQWFTSPKYAGTLEYGGTYGGAYLLRRGLFMPWELTDVLEPEVVAEGWQELQALDRLEASRRGAGDERQIISALELQWYMRNQLLRDSDWAGMAHSVEIRLPYVDVPFFRAVAPLISSRGAPSKNDLVTQLRPRMPDAVVHRNKTGFIVPVREWCIKLSGGEYEERGLRGWAKMIMARTAGHGLLAQPTKRRSVCALSGAPHPAGAAYLQRQWNGVATLADRPAHGRLRASRRAQAFLAHTAYRHINGYLHKLAVLLWPAARPRDARRVCIYRIGNIGDIVCALPAMRAVRLAYPHAHLTLLSSPGPQSSLGALELKAGLPWIDELIVYYSKDIETLPKRWSLLRELRARRFDVWIELPNNLSTVSRQLRDMSFTRMLGVRWARGWQVGTLRWAAQAQSEYLRFANEVERLLGVLTRSGIAVSRLDYDLQSAGDHASTVDRLLQEAGMRSRRLVALAPGAKRSTNRWPVKRFSEVGRELARLGYSIVLIGGEPDRALCEMLVEQIGPNAGTFAGRVSVLESCELLRRCDVLIAVDSGVQHLAAAVGTACVSLFSFWQMTGKWRPHGPRHDVIQKWVSCHTCLLELCPHDNACMTRITVPEVVRAAKGLVTA